MEQLARRLSLGAVVVVGAGMSLLARYPDTLGLNGLLWDALDADPEARADLAAAVSLPDAPAKTLVGDDFTKWDLSWRTIATSEVARRRFQREFVALDSHRANRPSINLIIRSPCTCPSDALRPQGRHPRAARARSSRHPGRSETEAQVGC